MNNEVYQLYDRIFKRIFTLSDLSIINIKLSIIDKNRLKNGKNRGMFWIEEF